MSIQNFASFYDNCNLLMCPPTYFRPLNPHPKYGFPNDMSKKGYEIYSENPKAFKKKSFEQWEKLYQLLKKLLLNVELLDPITDYSDQVFTADASLSLNSEGQDVTVISKFTHWNRSEETAAHKTKIAEVYPQRSVFFMSNALEGSGDNIYDFYRDCFWSGYSRKLSPDGISGGRSSLHSHKKLEQYTGVSIKSLEVRKPFFHIDTTFSPLTRGHILYYPKGLSEKAQTLIKMEGAQKYNLNPSHYLIPVTTEEALNFACNVINIGNIIVMNECGNRLPNKLRSYGYDVYVLDLSYFIKAGGGPHCLINNINQNRVIGGLHQQNNF